MKKQGNSAERCEGAGIVKELIFPPGIIVSRTLLRVTREVQVQQANIDILNRATPLKWGNDGKLPALISKLAREHGVTERHIRKVLRKARFNQADMI